jgi:hypothetical protein
VTWRPALDEWVVVTEKCHQFDPEPGTVLRVDMYISSPREWDGREVIVENEDGDWVVFFSQLRLATPEEIANSQLEDVKSL